MRLVRTALALAIATPLAAHAGVVIEGTDSSGDGEKSTQRILLEGQKLRIESGKGGQAMIFDGATRRSIQLDPENKSYVEFTKEDMAKMQALVTSSGKPAAKEPKHTVRYEKTGRADKALGKPCDVYRMVDSARPDDKDEMCLAPFGSFGVSKDDLSAFRAFGEYASEMGGGEIDKGWADIPGVPLVTWDVDGGERKEDFRATKIEKRAIPASEFTVPAGWKKGPGFAEQMQQIEEMRKQMNAPPKK